ncbi:MAG: hypothetical protein ACQEXJ_14055 [Myxococcota bacterium]
MDGSGRESRREHMRYKLLASARRVQQSVASFLQQVHDRITDSS